MLVELTSSSTSSSLSDDVTHEDVEEAFEAAIHSVLGDQEGLEQLWWEYLVLRREEACKERATAHTVKVEEAPSLGIAWRIIIRG